MTVTLSFMALARSRRARGHSGLRPEPWFPPAPPQFDGLAKEEIQQVAADFCSYQSIALELIKTKQRKESRFQLFMQVSASPGPFLGPGLPWLELQGQGATRASAGSCPGVT